MRLFPLLLAALCGFAASQPQPQSLAAFNSVAVCAPVTVNLVPGRGTNGSIVYSGGCCGAKVSGRAPRRRLRQCGWLEKLGRQPLPALPPPALPLVVRTATPFATPPPPADTIPAPDLVPRLCFPPDITARVTDASATPHSNS